MKNLSDLLKKGKKTIIAGEAEEDELKKTLTKYKLKEVEEQTAKKAQAAGVPYINLADFPISEEAIKIIDINDANQYNLVCFYRTEKQAKLGSTNVENDDILQFRQKLEQDYNLKTQLYFISSNSFDKAIKRYASLPKITGAQKGVKKITPEEFREFEQKIKTFKDLEKEIQKIPLSKLVTLVIASALKSRTSDIHIETEEKEVKVRFRIDGVLIDAASIDKKQWPSIISRIKLLSELKLNIVNKPQDGRLTIDLENKKVDVRVSCLPTAYGESVVMRLLKSSATGLSFEDLGFRKEVFGILKQEVERPNGMILTTGPTSSGKTTTLYAVLNKLNDSETKIITLEDPIEYHLKGINQSQVDKSKDYTFAKGLRSILRQDPDVVMVGEIRDIETAEIALQAALTGHLVISTLHTNDASGALPRFLGLGVKPYLLAPAINAVIGQRLIRKVCKECKEKIALEPEALEQVNHILSEIPKNSGVVTDFNPMEFYKGRGCDACQGLGYKGRTGIYEVFAVDKDIEAQILSGELSEYKMKELAQKQGMITMVQDGILKALEGITTVEEVFRVIE